MKLCKICNKEIIDTTRWIYCSEKCVYESKLINNKNKNIAAKVKLKKQKESWNYVEVKIGKAKHKKGIAINNLGLTNSLSTHLKLLLREYNLTSKRDIKIKRNDGATKSYLIVVVTPRMIEILFDKRYEVYKQNFRLDCLRTVKTLEKVFNIVNDYYSKDI